MTGLWRVAVIFVCEFIYKAYYVSRKKTTYYSAKNSNNKFHNKCHLYIHLLSKRGIYN